MEKEIWKDIIGFEGIYKISNTGKIFKYSSIQWMEVNKGYRTFKEHYLKGNIGSHGYIEISLCKNGVRSRYLLHRLLMQTFVSNPENKRTVNHINGIKTDNALGNLEWATDAENIIHAYKTGLNKMTEKRRMHSIGENNATSKLNTIQVIEIRKILLNKLLTQKEIAIKYNVSQAVISYIKLNKIWKNCIL